MIDVCFSRMAEGILKSFRKSLDSKAVFHLGGYLDVGDLTESIQEHYAKEEAETLRYFYKDITDEEITDAYKDELKQIRTRHTNFRKYIDSGESVRVWISRKANDYCGFFWLCNEMKKLSNKLYVVICPTYEYSTLSRKYQYTYGWGLEPESVIDIVRSSKEMNQGEIDFLAREWDILVKENKSLRILVDDKVVPAESDFFDSVILSFVSKVPTKQSEIMGEVLGRWPCCMVSLVSERIEHMVEKGLIAVNEEIADEHGCYWPRKIVKSQN